MLKSISNQTFGQFITFIKNSCKNTFYFIENFGKNILHFLLIASNLISDEYKNNHKTFLF